MSELIDQIVHHVWKQADSQVCDQVSNQVIDQLEDRVMWKVFGQVSVQIRKQTWAAGNRIMSQVGDHYKS